jgi:hypothetical protein
MKELNTFKQYLTESEIKENILIENTDDEISKLEKQLAILKKKKLTGGIKPTPEQLAQIEKDVKKKFEANDYDEYEARDGAAYFTLQALLNGKWNGKKLTYLEFMNNDDAMAQSLGYEDFSDFSNYTDTIADKVIG